MSLSSLPRLSKRLAPIQDKAQVFGSEEELLMDMSLTELQKKSPVKGRKAKREQITDDDLDKLSQEDLERLAWEAVEEENRLERRKSPRRSSSKVEETMKNVTIRRKSNTPRKKDRAEIEQDKIAEGKVDDERLEECFAPLPKSTSTSAVKHSYDRQASPSRSALRRPHIRKSVAFGEVAEYEISSASIEVERSSSIPMMVERATSSNNSSSQVSTREEQSSSPLSRFKGVRTAPLPVAKVVFKATKTPQNPTIRTSIRVEKKRLSDASASGSKSEPTRKTTSTLSSKSPIAKTRLREAIQASSAKSRLKARESAAKEKEKAKVEVNVPNGFRLSSTGTLIAQTKCTPFSVNPVSRSRKTIAIATAPSALKSNPVPAWLKTRQNNLKKGEEERLQKEIERVRAEELAVGQIEERTNEEKKKKRRPAASAAQPAYSSAVDKRITERAAWEAKRKANEDLLQQEKEKARQQREEREEEEYRLARQKTVIRANPVPNFIRTRTAK